ncbi:hypothetical protein CK203_049446 [Vitis vinifera]|uniref:Uncharacterized protein n=1 Tax=Vitis vinifera TaxID=29760 RepID=A0A438HAV9_VITVI|nr:hypothetical protein CK203_049446 [Vitis vinifera]
MCGGDDHLAWKRPVSSRRAEGCVPSELRVHQDQYGFELQSDTFYTLMLCSFHVDLPSWVRVEGSLVRFFERSDMDRFISLDDLDSIPVASLWPSSGCLTLRDVLRRELEGFRQRSDESISSFISAGGKIAEIVD